MTLSPEICRFIELIIVSWSSIVLKIEDLITAQIFKMMVQTGYYYSSNIVMPILDYKEVTHDMVILISYFNELIKANVAKNCKPYGDI